MQTQKERKKITDNRTIPIAGTIVLLAILIVGIFAVSSPFMRYYLQEEASDFYKYQQDLSTDFFCCHNCNTIVPCPWNNNGTGRPCPSCGVMMNIIPRSVAAAQIGPFQNSNPLGVVPTAWGGRNGGLGLGPVGNLVCPGCGTVVPKRRGVPAYSVNCPKCGMKMYRQLPANMPTAYYNNNATGNQFFQNTPGNQSFQQNYYQSPPPITSNAMMPHEYRGVCSNCHQILDLPAGNSNPYSAVGGSPYGGGGNNPYCVVPGGYNVY